MADDRSNKLIFLFILFLIMLNYPILSIFDRREIWFGIPALYFYLFFLWMAAIISIAFIVRNKKNK